MSTPTPDELERKSASPPPLDADDSPSGSGVRRSVSTPMLQRGRTSPLSRGGARPTSPQRRPLAGNAVALHNKRTAGPARVRGWPLDELCAALTPFLGSEELSDVTLVVGGERFHAHRVLLAAWSPPFRVMFTNGMRETTSREVAVEDVGADAVRLMLKFMYTGDIHVNSANALDVLAVATRFEIEPLVSFCESYLIASIKVRNCAVVLAAADRYSCRELYPACLAFVALHFRQALSSRRALGALDDACMAVLLRSDDLVVDREEDVLEELLSWREVHVALGHERTDAAVARLLPLVRFPLMSTDYLRSVVERHPVIGSMPPTRDLLFEAYRHHATAQGGSRPGSASGTRPGSEGGGNDDGSDCGGPAVAAGDDDDEDELAAVRRRPRGAEVVVFGPDAGMFTTVSPSISKHYHLNNIRRRDERYWLPATAEKAEIGFKFDQPYRLVSFTLSNRHSCFFQVRYRLNEADQWRVAVPSHPSGPHRHRVTVDLRDGPPVVARHVMVLLKGRASPSYHTSVYWIEVVGKHVTPELVAHATGQSAAPRRAAEAEAAGGVALGPGG